MKQWNNRSDDILINMFLIGLLVIGLLVIIFLFASPQLSPIPYFPTNKKDLPQIINALKLKNNQINKKGLPLVSIQHLPRRQAAHKS